MNSVESRPSPPSYEAFWKQKYQTEKQKSGWLRYALMWLFVIVSVAIVLTIVGLCLHFFVFKDKDKSPNPSVVGTTTRTNRITETTRSPPASSLPPATILNQTIAIRDSTLSSDQVNIVSYPSSTGEPAFLFFDFKTSTIAFLASNGSLISKKTYSITATQDYACSSCQIHYIEENCQRNECDDMDTIYCCESCAKLSNSDFCNVFGDSTTISGISPFTAGVYLPISSQTHQPYFIFNTKAKISNNTELIAYKYVAKDDKPLSLKLNTTGLNFGENFDSLQSLYRDFEGQNGDELLFWQVYISSRTVSSTTIKVTTSNQDDFPSFQCEIPTMQGDSIRLQLSSDNRSRLQITVIKKGEMGTEIWACLVIFGSQTSISSQLVYSSSNSNEVTIRSISTNEDAKILVFGSDFNLIVFKIYWNT
ncbi:unnamed protein product, partial [Mesorhabditis belari]|uniref:Uncharacterized protein n=1 Tax=Mesorhabditis belari TaxID=2138241 RepID=A0AAF3FCE5_9BILA